MPNSRFTEKQMARILRETDTRSVADVAREHDVSAETLYRWKRKLGGTHIKVAKRRPIPPSQEAKLKKMLVERLLEIDISKKSEAKKS